MIKYEEMTKEQRKLYGFVTLSAREKALVKQEYNTKKGLIKLFK